MSFTAVTLPPSTSTSSSADSRSHHRYFKKPPRHSFTYHHHHHYHHAELTFRFQSPIPSPSRSRVFVLRGSKRGGPSSSLVDDPPRNWSRSIMSSSSGFVLDDDDHYDDDDEEEDRSFDLLVRFVQNAFKKISKRARKALRSVLPLSISTKLVGFSVNGVLLLAFLWVLKAFLEVVCTLGSVVFVSILLIRGIWSGVTYLHEGRNLKMNELDDDHRAWTGAQPAT